MMKTLYFSIKIIALKQIKHYNRNDEEVNNNKNYFYNSNINYNNLNPLKLNIKLTN